MCMKKILIIALLLTVIQPYLSQSQSLIKNVQVIDVEKRKILSGYDVLCLDGKIISIEKGRMYKLPEGTRVIDGTGKYLIPGFVDAHVHFFQSGGLFARPDVIDLRKHQPYAKELKWVHDHMADFLHRYLSAGITSVIDVGSSFAFLSQRDSFVAKIDAPHISMTGPLLTTYIPPAFKDLGDEGPFIEIKSDEQARQSVRYQVTHKADFIKIWYIVLDKDKEAGARKNLPLISAVIDEAHKSKLRVAVHATERITAQLAVEAGADFLVHNIDDEVVTESFTSLLKKKGVVLCPTMVVEGNYEKVLADKYSFSTDELSLNNPVTTASILDYPWPDTTLAKLYIKNLAIRAQNKDLKEEPVAITNLKKLYAAGVTIATGTDAGNIGTQHVGSYFNELKAMENAGINLWDLLIASTINGAKAAGRQLESGSISKGKEANMVLLNSNPFDSLTNWRKISFVINKGQVLDPNNMVESSPEILAQQQLNAYNAHDVEAFLVPYAEDVEVYEFPSKLLSKGKEQMRKDYQFIKTVPGLYCKLLNRIVQGNIIIDHEEIYINGRRNIYGIAIYQVENGKISKVYFPK